MQEKNKESTKQSRLTRRKVTNSTERSRMSEMYDHGKILAQARVVMENDVKDAMDKKTAKADCLFANPSDVAAMMQRVYSTEFPYVDINTIFVGSEP